MKRIEALFLILLFVASFSAHSEDGCAQVSDLKEIPITRGINKVPHFGVQGEAAL